MAVNRKLHLLTVVVKQIVVAYARVKKIARRNARRIAVRVIRSGRGKIE